MDKMIDGLIWLLAWLVWFGIAGGELAGKAVSTLIHRCDTSD
jgi:hypothetical protein